MDNKELNELIVKYKSGDKNALAKIYCGIKKQVFSVVYPILNNYERAESITEDTFVKLMEKINLYKDGTNAKAFILTMARNLAINEYNRNKKYEYVDFQTEEYRFGEENIEDKKETPILDLAKEILSQEENEILTLYIVSGLKHREIAQMLNKPLGTVLWIYNKSVKKVKTEIEKRGIDNFR